MAIENKIIKLRRGIEANFIPTNLLPGELHITTDTGKVHYCYSAGNIKQLATIEQLQALLNVSPEAYLALQQLITELQDETVLTGLLADMASLQAYKLDKTGDSKDNTVTFTEATTETDIATGENHATLFGKILKSIKTFRSAIGTLSSLKTTNKTSLVGAINEQNDSLANLFIKRRFVNTITVGTLNVIGSTNITIDAIDGYTPIEYIVANAHPSNTISSIGYVFSDRVTISYIPKTAGSEQFLVDVVYAKSSFVGS